MVIATEEGEKVDLMICLARELNPGLQRERREHWPLYLNYKETWKFCNSLEETVFLHLPSSISLLSPWGLLIFSNHFLVILLQDSNHDFKNFTRNCSIQAKFYKSLIQIRLWESTLSRVFIMFPHEKPCCNFPWVT